MCDLFIISGEIDFASYADDNTHFVSEATPEKIGERTISNSFRKLLRVQINSQRNFNNYLETIIKISMIHVLARTRPHVCISKRKLLINAFFKS